MDIVHSTAGVYEKAIKAIQGNNAYVCVPCTQSIKNISYILYISIEKVLHKTYSMQIVCTNRERESAPEKHN